MKNINPYLMIAVAAVLSFSSCTKEKEIIPDLPTKKVWVKRSVSESSVNRYNRDNSGRLLSYIVAEGVVWKDSIGLTYDSNGNISMMRWLIYSAGSKSEFTYDTRGKLITKSGYGKDGKLVAISNYSYFDDRFEELRTFADNSINRAIYFYTPDKKNIAEFKLYGTSGKVAEESTYTYGTIKAPKFGYEQIMGHSNVNVAEKTVTTVYNNAVPGSTPVTTTYFQKATANADGYAASLEYSSSNSTSTSTSNYEYIVK